MYVLWNKNDDDDENDDDDDDDDEQVGFHSPKKNQGISWPNDPIEDKQYKKCHRRIALTAWLIMVFTFDLVQIELKCISGNSAIFIPLLFIKLGSFHFKPAMITRSHPQASFSKALTSHVRHHYKKTRSIFAYLKFSCKAYFTLNARCKMITCCLSAIFLEKQTEIRGAN